MVGRGESEWGARSQRRSPDKPRRLEGRGASTGPGELLSWGRCPESQARRQPWRLLRHSQLQSRVGCDNAQAQQKTRMARTMRVASGLTLFALARGQGLNCGEAEPVYSAAAFTTRNSHPDECRSPDGANLGAVDWGRVVTACQGIIPSSYTSAPYGLGTTAEQCSADLCEATPECTAAIEAYANDLESCNPAGNYLQGLYRAVAWRDACIGARAEFAPTSPRAHRT